MTDAYIEYLSEPTRERYTQFVIAYLPVLRRFVRRFVRSEDLASDILQETFLALAGKVQTPAAIRRPRSYVLGVTYRTVQSQRRRTAIRMRHEKHASRLRRERCTPSCDPVADREILLRLETAIDALPEFLRVVMHLHAIEGLPVHEIAVVIGSTRSAVSMRLTRARKRLRKAIGARELSVGLLQLRALDAELPAMEPLAPAAGSHPVLGASSRAPARASLPMSMGVVSLCILALLLFVYRESRSTPAPIEVGSDSMRRAKPSAAGNPRAEATSRRSRILREKELVAGQRSHAVSLPPSTIPFSESQTITVASRDTETGMKPPTSPLYPALLSLGASLASHGAETGDVDGDGRISINDVLHVQAGLPPAAGSFEQIDAWCQGFAFLDSRVFIYMESLRRNVSGSNPHWIPLDSTWSMERPQSPLQESTEATVEIEDFSMAGGLEAESEMVIVIRNARPIRAFSLIVNVEGASLQPPFLKHLQCSNELSWWYEYSWHTPFEMSACHRHNTDGIEVYVIPPTFLITNGKYVVTRGIPFDADRLEPGIHRIPLRVKLVAGVEAGDYTVRIHPGSEVVFEGGDGVRPRDGGSGKMHVAARPLPGVGAEGLPPLVFDSRNRSVLKKVEFRLVNESGDVGTEDLAVANAVVGDQVTLRMQMRTEVPLNDLFVMLNWRPRELECDGGSITSLFTNPEDGRPYAPYPSGTKSLPSCAGNGVGAFKIWYRLAGAWSTPGGDAGNNYTDRVFEYFKPLGEWVDIAEVSLTVSADAKGGELPLVFSRYHRRIPGELNTTERLGYSPYFSDWPCDQDMMPFEGLWRYDITYYDTFVNIFRDDEPEVPNAEIEVLLEESVEGAPGELVRVPITALAPTGPSLLVLRLVVALESELATIEGVSTWVTSDRTGERQLVTAMRGETAKLVECADADNDGVPDELPCPRGHPTLTTVYDTAPPFTQVDWALQGRGYLSKEPVLVGYLLVRLAATATGQIAIEPGAFLATEGGLEVEKSSGGVLIGFGGAFSPALQVEASTITVRTDLTRFIRGDANQDTRIDLSDAVSVLGYLFLGQVSLDCLKAADVNADGALELTDAIFLLGVLFLGVNEIPPPGPTCEGSGSSGALSCSTFSC